MRCWNEYLSIEETRRLLLVSFSVVISVASIPFGISRLLHVCAIRRNPGFSPVLFSL
jgi:hypothetical protein